MDTSTTPLSVICEEAAAACDGVVT